MTPRLITLSSEQRSAAGRDDDACPMHCEALHRGILTPRAMCRRAHDWRGLDRDEPSTDVSIVVPRARASRLRYRPSACRARAAKLVTGFTLETETAATCALLRVHALTIRNAFRLASSYALARRWFPSHRRRTHVPLRTGAFWASTPTDPRAFARRPGVIRRLGDGSMCALHRFTRARRTATVRGVSVKLLRARPRVPGVPSGYRAPRPRCIRPTSTHPSSRPREPVPSCAPDVISEACAVVLTHSPRGLGGTAGRLTVLRTSLLAEP
jgi:hypothetical protein